MLQPGSSVSSFSLPQLDGGDWRLERGKPSLLVFFETDCPTCHLTIPYLNRLAQALDGKAEVVGISQDGEAATRELVEQAPIKFTVGLDRDLSVSREYDPQAVPTLFLIEGGAKIARTSVAFDKAELNAIAAEMLNSIGVEPFELAGRRDGAPEAKPGCVSRHLEVYRDLGEEQRTEGGAAASVNLYVERVARHARGRRRSLRVLLRGGLRRSAARDPSDGGACGSNARRYPISRKVSARSNCRARAAELRDGHCGEDRGQCGNGRLQSRND